MIELLERYIKIRRVRLQLHKGELNTAFEELYISGQIIAVKIAKAINKFPTDIFGKIPVDHRSEAPEFTS